jgi:hypothetical protein
MRNRFNTLLPAIFIGLCGSTAQAETELLQQVRANYATLSRATADFENARASGTLPASEATDFVDWINYLITQVLNDCRALALESNEPMPEDLPCREFMVSRPSSAGIDIATEQTKEEHTAVLVDQLHNALGKFDEELLQEQKKIKAQAPRSDAQVSTSSGEGDGEGSEEYAGAGAQTEAGQKESEGAAAEDYDADSGAQVAEEGGQREGGDGQRQTAGSTTGSIGKQGQNLPSGTPEDIPDGSDDDVVARQIREAAEKETDPELKKKLWQEYKRYKAGTG